MQTVLLPKEDHDRLRKIENFTVVLVEELKHLILETSSEQLKVIVDKLEELYG